MRKTLLIAAGLLVVLFAALTLLLGGPKSAYGLVRFALPQMSRGELRVGDPAPDVALTALDGQTTFQLRQKVSGKPLVLIFGSYT